MCVFPPYDRPYLTNPPLRARQDDEVARSPRRGHSHHHHGIPGSPASSASQQQQHRRTYSDTNVLRRHRPHQHLPRGPHGPDASSNHAAATLDSGRAFDWPQTPDAAAVPPPSPPRLLAASSTSGPTIAQWLRPERSFVDALTAVGRRLTAYPTRALRMHQLYAELALLNLNLPARVFLPLGAGGAY